MSRIPRVHVVLALLLLALIIGLALVLDPVNRLPTKQWAEQLQSAGVQGALVFLAVGMAATAVGLPRQLLAFIGGYAYGVSLGLTLTLMASIAGCALTVLVSSTLLRQPIRNRYPIAITALDKLVRHDAFIKILVLRLQPFGTNFVSNVCAGLTSMSIPVFLVASLIGYVPQALIFTLTGSGIRVGSTTQLRISVVLFILSLGLGYWLYRRHVIRRDVQASPDAEA